MSVKAAQYSSAVISVQYVGCMTTTLTKDSSTVISVACAGCSPLIVLFLLLYITACAVGFKTYCDPDQTLPIQCLCIADIAVRVGVLDSHQSRCKVRKKNFYSILLCPVYKVLGCAANYGLDQ